MADKLLRLDPLGLRHKLPRRAFVWLHATGRRVAYRYTNTEQVGGQSGITDEEFFLTEDIDPSTLVLFAVCRDPRCARGCAPSDSTAALRRRRATTASATSRATAARVQAWVTSNWFIQLKSTR